ncbi:transposase [Actinoplanes sp. NPDC004185]
MFGDPAPGLARHYYRANKLWSSSYLASSVGGAPVSIVKQYIEQRNRPVQSTAWAWRPSQRGLHPRA